MGHEEFATILFMRMVFVCIYVAKNLPSRKGEVLGRRLILESFLWFLKLCKLNFSMLKWKFPHLKFTRQQISSL